TPALLWIPGVICRMIQHKNCREAKPGPRLTPPNHHREEEKGRCRKRSDEKAPEIAQAPPFSIPERRNGRAPSPESKLVSVIRRNFRSSKAGNDDRRLPPVRLRGSVHIAIERVRHLRRVTCNGFVIDAQCTYPASNNQRRVNARPAKRRIAKQPDSGERHPDQCLGGPAGQQNDQAHARRDRVQRPPGPLPLESCQRPEYKGPADCRNRAPKVTIHPETKDTDLKGHENGAEERPAPGDNSRESPAG